MRHTWGSDVTGFDRTFVDKVRLGAEKLFGPGKYFDLSIRGRELIPTSRPVMLVSNHSGGTTIPDVWGLAVAWYEHFGSSRPLHILAHDLLFALPQAAHIFERLGVLRASNNAAHKILESGRDVLIYPGGDIEVWRPYSKRYEVNFSGRTGYARLAHELKVPIVPIAHAGSHETLRVLTSGRWIARSFGMHRIARAEIFPISLSIPWGLTLGPLPHIPLPARFRYIVGKPILATETCNDPVRAFDTQVRRTIQAQLDVLREEDLELKRKKAA